MAGIFSAAGTVLWVCLSVLGGSFPARAAVEKPAASYLEGLTWLGHAGFRLERGGATVYFDPWRVREEPRDGDLVLISHPHFDHLDPESVARVAKPGGLVVTVPEAAGKLREGGWNGRMETIAPGGTLEEAGVRVEAVAAYNLDKPFHPKANGWVGFIVEADGVRFYHAGDTDFIPEMKALRQVHVALLPVSGTYVMTASEAAQAARLIRPQAAVPMHYGAVVGTEADAKAFQEAAGPIIVEILREERPLPEAAE